MQREGRSENAKLDVFAALVLIQELCDKYILQPKCFYLYNIIETDAVPVCAKLITPYNGFFQSLWYFCVWFIELFPDWLQVNNSQ